MRFLFLCVLFFGLTYSVKAEVDYDYFDSFFRNNEFNIYTDLDINDYHTFTSIIQSSVNSYIYTEGNSSNYFHSYRLSFECSYENMNCSFYLNDDATINV